MAESNAGAWITQADSDRWAASKILDPAEPRSFCQAIAKHQQTVEKSIKAIAAALRERFIVFIPVGYKHDAARIASALRRPAQPNDLTDIQHHINSLFNDYRIGEIKALDALAPRKPSTNALHMRNTEYPYEEVAGQWRAPAAVASFSLQEVKRFDDLAESVFQSAKQIVSALRR